MSSAEPTDNEAAKTTVTAEASANNHQLYQPVPLAPRCNGWTAERQRGFLAALAGTGSVALACERVGMAKRSAYRLRARPDAAAFAQGWNAALNTARARDAARNTVARRGDTPTRRQMFQAIRDCNPHAFAKPSAHPENSHRA